MKRVLVTGGSRGLGAACVELFSQRGWEVTFTYGKSREKAQELCQRLPNVSCVACDLAQCGDLYEKAKSWGSFDAVVNNGGESLFGLFQDVDVEEAQRFFNVDFFSSFHLLRALCPAMIRKEGGACVNVSSMWGRCGASCEALYSSAKAALEGLTRALAWELAPSGVRVNAVSPGVIDTDMNARFSPEEREELCKEIPLGRFAEAEEIAKLIYFLCTEDSSYITGQVLCPDGGQVMER